MPVLSLTKPRPRQAKKTQTQHHYVALVERRHGSLSSCSTCKNFNGGSICKCSTTDVCKSKTKKNKLVVDYAIN